jgi:hypothetical protein
VVLVAHLEVVWSGAMLHALFPWSGTKGELSSWPPQRGRALGADPLDALDIWPCRDPSQCVPLKPRPRLVDDDDDAESAGLPLPVTVVTSPA